MDFFFDQSQNLAPKFKKIEDCASSSTYISFWMGPSQILCLDLDLPENNSILDSSDAKVGKVKKRSVFLEKTKYSLVANSSNYLDLSGPSELVSSTNKLAVRFFSKQGRFQGRGFRAKFKIGKDYLLN